MAMEKVSASEGDILKHSLLLEVLGRCSWDNLTYAETHAGAGLYSVSGQPEAGSHAHIRNLRTLLSKSERPVSRDMEGGRYYHLLANWWSDPLHDGLYPGSVLQAAIWNRLVNRTIVSYRVTEADRATCCSLKKSLKDFNIQPECSPFQNKLSWLTEKDNLVLLIDPYRYSDATGPRLTRELNEGAMDLDTLHQIIMPLWGKKGCVFGFWCAVADSTAWAKRKRFTDSLRQVASTSQASWRVFAYGRYSMVWIGIGKGKGIVDDIPKPDKWKKSWLKRVVKEKNE